MKKSKTISIFAIAMITALGLSASAQQTREQYQQRNNDLIALSGVFGEMHHIRRSCEPRVEADIWRDRMKKLVELEEPTVTVRNEWVASFNAAYKRAQSRFPYCDRSARDYAAARAREGERIVARLMTPLYEAMNDDNGAPFIWQGAAGPAVDPGTE